jgi:hypothetical protein
MSSSSTSNAPRTYQQIVDAINADANLDETEKAELLKQAAQQEYGAKAFDIGEFDALLSRLEGSKMRQQRQKSVEGRRDIMSQGLASMMSNF